MRHSEETVKKYFDALKKLKTILEYQPKMGLQPYCNKEGLSKNASVEIINGGLVKNTGTRGKGVNYIWNTIDPNLKMAEELVKRCNKVGVDSMKKTRKNKTTVYKYLSVDHTVTKYLWGLIKIKTNYYYKPKL